METEATLDLLYKELDHSLLENGNIENEGSYVSTIKEEDEKDVENEKENVLLDDEVDTQVSSNSPLLSSPFKVQGIDFSQSDINREFEKPVIRNINMESLSGGTYINHSNRQVTQLSPSSMKLMNILENANDDYPEDGNGKDDQDEEALLIKKVRKDITSSKSFNVDSSEPLLSYDHTETSNAYTPHRLSMISTEGKLDLDCSPQIRQSPVKIPLTNTNNVNQYVPSSSPNQENGISGNIDTTSEISEESSKAANFDIPTTRFSSGSSYDNDKLELSNDKIKDEFNLLSERANTTNTKIPDKLPVVADAIANDLNPPFGKLYKERMVSVVTSIGDYQSAKENQTKSQLEPETTDSLADLDISTGANLYNETFQKDKEDDPLPSLNEDGDSTEITQSGSFTKLPNKIFTENTQEFENSSLVSDEKNQKAININPIIVSPEVDLDNSNVEKEDISECDSINTKIHPNQLLIDSLRMGTSRESTQTLELDITTMMKKRRHDESSTLSERVNSEGSSTIEEDLSISSIEEKTSVQKNFKDKQNPDPNKEILVESNIRIPSVKKEPTLESKFIDDIFNSEGDTSIESAENELLTKPDNYLAIWHIQEKKVPALNLKVKGSISDLPKVTTNNEAHPKLKKLNYSFKPRVIHNPTINYHESHKINPNITTSLSQEFESALKTLTADPPSRTNSTLHRPVTIWSKDDEGSKMERLNSSKELSLREVFGEDFSTDSLKTPGKSALINRADSIKSFKVDTAYNLPKFTPSTPTKKENSCDNVVSRGNGHVRSPFKVISSKMQEKMIPQPAINVADASNKEPETSPSIKEGRQMLTEESLEQNLPKGKEELGGILYINLERVKIPLSGITQHAAKFLLEIDNGVNVTRTEWKSLKDDNTLLLDNELAIPINNIKQEKVFLTLKCKYQRPKKQLVEVVEKVRVGKSFGGLGKSKYVYEKRYVERNIDFDEWDYLFAQDGSFARTELIIDPDFLTKNRIFRKQSVTNNMINQWAKLITNKNNQEKIPFADLPRRSPFVAAALVYKCYYAEQTNSLEKFPNTLKSAISMAEKYQRQQRITKEGFLVQDGGDLNGLIENRYFKLNGTELIGYHERSMKPKININLLNVKEITSTLDEKNIDGKPTRNLTNLFLFGECFTLLFNNNESISFNCQLSGKDTKEWYSTLKEVIDMNVAHQPWIKRLAEDL